MTNTVVKTANYALDSSFVYMNNVGVVLVKVGMPNAAFNSFHAMVHGLLKGARLAILTSGVRNIEFNDEIISWVDVEYLCIPTEVEEPLKFDIFAQFDMYASRAVMQSQPYVVSELDLEEAALIEKIMFRSTNNAEHTGDHPEYYPEGGIVFKGIQAKHDLDDQDFIRVITLHTSESTPVVTSYMTVGMVRPRQAPVVQFSPYAPTTHRLDSFTIGNTGEALIEELKATDLFMDTVPFETIRILLALPKLEQYRIARVMSEWKKLYGDLGAFVIISIIEQTSYYRNIIDLLELGYYPTRETLNALFGETPAKPANWNLG